MNTVPGVRFTSHGDTPPTHSSPRADRGDNGPNLQVPGYGDGSGGDPDGRQELRRSSIYSTVDMVPQLDFYADSLPAGPGRPTLKTLRRPTPFDVRLARWNNLPFFQMGDGALGPLGVVHQNASWDFLVGNI